MVLDAALDISSPLVTRYSWATKIKKWQSQRQRAGPIPALDLSKVKKT